MDISSKRSMTENESARVAVDLCYRIHKQYGPGLFESVYEKILFHELKKKGLKVKQQVAVPLIHGDMIITEAFRADLIVEEKLLIELKSVDVLSPAYYKQVITYLKLLNLNLGLLVNFNVGLIKEGIHRIVNNF
ncbi:MAG: GxxExxY protein [Flavisolibacter sp.]